MRATYMIPGCNVMELEAKIVKLNKRAVRLGVPEICVTKMVDHVKYEIQETGGRFVWVTTPPETKQVPRVMAWWKVEVEGEAPSFQGWEFIASLEPVQLDSGESENIIMCVPGKICPDEYRTKVGHCDHCSFKRRRNQTFVLSHIDGRTKCVGRQCLKDFLGYNDPHKLAVWAECLMELGSLCSNYENPNGSYGQSIECELLPFLAMTAGSIKNAGWASRSSARETQKMATADIVWTAFIRPEKNQEICKYEEKEHTDAENAIEWALSLSDADMEENNYLANVNLVARLGRVSYKTAGIAASIIIAWYKHQEREINRKKALERPESNWIGSVGSRIEPVKVTVENVIPHEGYYGLTGIHKMTDEHGNDLVWFSSSSSSEWLKEGETYYVAMTVKAHGEFQGRKQTTVSRLTVWTDKKVEAYHKKGAKKAREAPSLMPL